jgi:uncharacterized protein YecT (DUF1311 family)
MQVHKPFLSLSCIDEKTQKSMDKCGEVGLAKVTSQMKMLLEGLTKRYKKGEPDLSKAIQFSQQAWQADIEASCKVETYESRDGSGFNSIWNSCLETRTNERISYLDWVLESP